MYRVYELLSSVPSASYDDAIYYHFFSRDISPVLTTKSDTDNICWINFEQGTVFITLL